MSAWLNRRWTRRRQVRKAAEQRPHLDGLILRRGLDGQPEAADARGLSRLDARDASLASYVHDLVVCRARRRRREYEIDLCARGEVRVLRRVAL